MKYSFETIAVSVPDHEHGERQQAARPDRHRALSRAAPIASISIPTMKPTGVR